MLRLVLCIAAALLDATNAIAEMNATGKLFGERETRIADFDPNTSRDPLVPPDAPLFSGVVDGAVRTAIIDSGVLRRHPWLRHVVIEEKSFVGSDAEDAVGHGTAVALRFLSGLAQGARQLGRPPFGHGEKSPVAIISLKVTHDGAITLGALLRAIAFAGSMNVNSVNLSLGFEKDSISENDRRRLCEAIAQLPDILFVAASGNTRDIPVFPASCELPNVIPVAALDSPSGPAKGSVATNSAWRPVAASQRLARLFSEATASDDIGLAEAVLADMRAILGASLTTILAEAELLVRRQDHAGLKAHSASIDAVFRRDARYRFLVGVSAFHVRDFESALAAFLEARDGLSDFGPARFNLAQTLMELGRHAEALQELRALQSMSPDYPNLAQAISRAAEAVARPQ